MFISSSVLVSDPLNSRGGGLGRISPLSKDESAYERKEGTGKRKKGRRLSANTIVTKPTIVKRET
jgi:hypothetical protein